MSHPAALRRLQDDFVDRVIWAWHLAGRPRGVQLSSYTRSVAQNRRVGGQPDSQHLLGLAADFVGPGTSGAFPRELRRMGLIALDFGSHLHVQRLQKGRARQIGLFTRDV